MKVSKPESNNPAENIENIPPPVTPTTLTFNDLRVGMNLDVLDTAEKWTEAQVQPFIKFLNHIFIGYQNRPPISEGIRILFTLVI